MQMNGSACESLAQAPLIFRCLTPSLANSKSVVTLPKKITGTRSRHSDRRQWSATFLGPANNMHTNQPEPIEDRTGNVVGSIENLPNGDQVLRNAQNEVRGYYDAKGDYTRDADQKIVAKGNKLRSMIC